MTRSAVATTWRRKIANVVGLDWTGLYGVAYRGEQWTTTAPHWVRADDLTIRTTVRRGIEAAQSRFDLHHSNNGASGLKLYPVLTDCVAAGDPLAVRAIPEPPDTVTHDIDRFRASFGDAPVENPLVESEPTETDIAADEIGSTLDFLTYEALFLVSPDADTERRVSPVSVLLPVFVDITFVLIFMQFIEFSVYDRDRLSDDPSEAITAIQTRDIDPDHSVSGTEYLTLHDSPAVYEHFVEGHEGLLQALYSIDGSSHDEVMVTIATGDAYLIGRATDHRDIPVPQSTGTGLLIRLPVEDFTFDQLATLYGDWQYLAQRLRVDHAIDVARDVLAAIGESGLQSFDGEARAKALVRALGEEFDQEVSRLTPSEYRAVLDDRE